MNIPEIWYIKDWMPHIIAKTNLTDTVCSWLIKRNYPVPLDCPRDYDGCKYFHPVCFINGTCRFAREQVSLTCGKVHCATCDRIIDPSTEFRDDLSTKEFEISGMCQKCQDDIFKTGRKK